jgi:hypothetical protein
MEQRQEQQATKPKKHWERTKHVLASAAKSLKRIRAGGKLDRDFWYAARTGHHGEIRRLLKAGASITAKGSNGMTALQQAVWGFKTETCALIIFEYVKSGGDIRKLLSSKTRDGRTPLQNANHIGSPTAQFLQSMEWLVGATGNAFMKSFAECISG